MSPRQIAYVVKRFPRISETFVAAELIELERQGESLTVFAGQQAEEPLTHGFMAELSAPVIYLPRRPWREPLRTAGALVLVLRQDRRGWLGGTAQPPASAARRGWRRLATGHRPPASRCPGRTWPTRTPTSLPPQPASPTSRA